MSSLVVGLLAGGTQTIDPAQRRNAMIRAGDEINEWMQKNPERDKDDFFTFVYEQVTGAPDHFKVFYFDTDHTPRELSKSPPPPKKKKYEYTDSSGNTRFLQVKIEEDEASESRMTIVVPRDRGDLVSAGYIPEIVADLAAIDADTSITDAEKNSRKAKYILATVFLSRCH